MGEVYRVRDSRLNRAVAVKVLPPAFADDAARMSRFEREAQVLASLNHPNIAAIYGIEQGALVMELVEGEHLKGPLPLDTAIEVDAKQIAAALEAAHEKGIVHRDLKPANIMVTTDGVIKVLDFGLAAIPASSAGGANDGVNSPTLTMGATQAGIILGTAAYMSPEQATGKPVDKRADIWAFGVMLWEVLTGHQLFRGATVSHILAGVLKDTIDLEALPAVTPPTLRTLVRRCLERDTRKRLRDIGEARIALEDAASGQPATSETPAPGRRSVIWIAVLTSLAAGAISFVHFRETPASGPGDPHVYSSASGCRVPRGAYTPDFRNGSSVARRPPARVQRALR